MMDRPVWLTGVRIFSPLSSSDLPMSFRLENGKIDRIAEMPDFRNRNDRKTKIVDLSGCWISPGFTDCHIHLLSYSLARNRLVLDSLTLQQILKKVSDAVLNSRPGDWIRGRGWEINRWENPVFPNRRHLDEICRDRPVALSSKDGHALWLNSQAMKHLELDGNIPDPEGGCFIRDSAGMLTGAMLETAADLAIGRIPLPHERELKNALVEGIADLSALGLTGLHCFEKAETMRLIWNLFQARKIPIRLHYYLPCEELDGLIGKGVRSSDGDRYIRFGGIKLFADGALGSRTAAISDAYPGEPGNFGQIVTGKAELRDICDHAARHGIASAIHAIGDTGVSNALDALSHVRIHYPEISGQRIEHIQLIPPNRVGDFTKYRITASVQPAHALSDIEMAETLWKHIPGLLYPYGSIRRTGALMVFGSDAPIEPPGPLSIIRAAVTRRRIDGYPDENGWIPEERMTLTDALAASTLLPAVLEGRPGERGELTAGNAADLVVFDRDPVQADPDNFRENKVVMTLMNGNPVYDPNGLLSD
ncbi:amidohydrolase [bacterium]|nr:amidohydrolase [candidate division CSSED10-310 bacterium]